MKVLDIRVQKLFVIALVLKILFSALGWLLGSPWLLGFVIPLIIMCAYIWLGLIRRDTEVSDDKFADSAYYLGFIFTITSIIFSLFDLPNIGTKIQDISVRFGAAMVSTVFGLGVRVYLVTFRADFSDAIQGAEDALLRATQVFTERLKMSLERLQDFESSVDLASRSSVERVNLQIEAMSRNHAEKLAEFFADLTTRNEKVFSKALDEVKGASSKLAVSVDGYTTGMKSNLKSVEQQVSEFSAAVTARLQNTTFPDDYFAAHLKQPLAQLEGAAAEIAKNVAHASASMTRTAETLSGSLDSVNDKSAKAEESMDAIIRLAAQQKILLESAQGQIGALELIGVKLGDLDNLLSETVASLHSAHTINAALVTEVGKTHSQTTQDREATVKALDSLTQQLMKNAAVTDALCSRMDISVVSSECVVKKLEETSASQLSESSRLFSALDERSGHTLEKISETVCALQNLLRTVNLMVVNSSQQGSNALTSPVQLVTTAVPEIVVNSVDLATSLSQAEASSAPDDASNKLGSV